ncbi:MAG: TRAP transporter large permease [Alphaproteobacteria bacterium]|nr:TRAP transporter large permease [Alphaproteobacteria bacterium]MBU1280170.1 TRAP transporter large permease [Alphaproteobacteria bacterium]MBU1575380.1 TRAP transporter large permease [Alphaproteobacteria bacterium]MBU1830422.1 TRAP transporter large permease [Alphaproteobacteria bacterium]MBU2077586.1 TRAP transporter large permease [Alphaproteobacteria bacterium]
MSGMLLGGMGFFAAIVMIFLEVPVAVALGLVGVLGSAMIIGLPGAMAIGATTTWGSLTNYTLTMLPLFVMMGNLAARSGLSTKLYHSMSVLIGHRRGGLALATIGASAGFGMISGSSLATTATMGRIALPEMKAAGYSRSLSAGSVAAGGTLGILIPPSTVLVIYAFIAEQSIRDLLLATAGPIFLAVLLYCLAIWVPIWMGWSVAPQRVRAEGPERRSAIKELLPPVGIFGLIMGGLYSGVFTANETAAIGAAVVLAYGLLARRLSFEGFMSAIMDTAMTCGALYLVLIGANLFNFFLALSGLPFSLTGLFSGILDQPLLVILLMLAIYLVLGTLMDSLAMLLLTVPLFVPVAQAAGIDLVWFGIFAVMVVEMGLITPPVGMNLFVLKTVAPDVKLTELWKGAAPFVIADFIRVGIIIALPALVIWLPYHAI